MRVSIAIVFLFVNFITTYTYAENKIILPLACQLGQNCWISNLTRNYQGDKQVDFRCGPKTYKDHKGTDFAIRDLAVMEEGVDVLAPIDGIVRAIRDNVNDISIKETNKAAIAGKECGNAVVILKDDFEFQLCHLKKGSIKVKAGDRVKQGMSLAQIGLSGNTEYPHLHLTVRKKINNQWKEFDPFYGLSGQCGKEPKPIWLDTVALNEHTGTGIVYNYGFSFEIPKAENVRSGKYNKLTLPEQINLIISWADIFSVEQGDSIILRIEDNNGKTITEKQQDFNKYQARYFIYIGKKISDVNLLKNLRLTVEYHHKSGKVDKFYKSLAQ